MRWIKNKLKGFLYILLKDSLYNLTTEVLHKETEYLLEDAYKINEEKFNKIINALTYVENKHNKNALILFELGLGMAYHDSDNNLEDCYNLYFNSFESYKICKDMDEDNVNYFYYRSQFIKELKDSLPEGLVYSKLNFKPYFFTTRNIDNLKPVFIKYMG